MYEFAPDSQIVSWIGHQICNEESNPDFADVCANLAFAFMGLNPDQFNRCFSISLLIFLYIGVDDGLILRVEGGKED